MDPHNGNVAPVVLEQSTTTTDPSNVTDPSPSRSDSPVSGKRTFFGQPASLVTIANLEVWERFSYFGMQAILAIYLYWSVTRGGLGLPPAVAVGIVGAYGGVVYLAAIVAGWTSDRLLGAERVLFYSAIVVMAGHIALAALPGIFGLITALILIALGAGGVKVNSAAVLGELYDEDDPTRDAGFSIYYMAICVGAFLGPIMTGLVQSIWGFHFGFGLAAVGMAVGLFKYSRGRKRLPASANRVPNPLPKSKLWVMSAYVGAGVLVVLLGVTFGIITVSNLVYWTAGLCATALVAYFALIIFSNKVTGVERSRTISFIPMVICAIILFSLMMQGFGVLVTYADYELNRSIGGWEIPVAWVPAMQSFFLIIFAPIFSWLWMKLGKRQPSAPVKFGIALPVIGIAFLLFIPYANSSEGNATPLLWMTLCLMLISSSELLVGPIGVSLSTKLGPQAFRTQMVSVWFLALSLGTTMAGVFGQFYDPDDQVPYWLLMGGLGIVGGAIQLMIAPRVKKAMRGVS